jgi:hypothetical protein
MFAADLAPGIFALAGTVLGVVISSIFSLKLDDRAKAREAVQFQRQVELLDKQESQAFGTRREAEIKSAGAALLAAGREYVFSDEDPPSSSDLIDRVIDVQLICPPAAVRAALVMLNSATAMHEAETKQGQQDALERYMRDGLHAFVAALRDYFGLEPLKSPSDIGASAAGLAAKSPPSA